MSSPAPQVVLRPYPGAGPFLTEFDWNKAVITPEAAAVLDNAAAAYANISDQVVVRIDAPISPEGTAALGKRRGAALKAYLIGKGVPVSSIQTIITRRGSDADGGDSIREPQFRMAEIDFYTVTNGPESIVGHVQGLGGDYYRL